MNCNWLVVNLLFHFLIGSHGAQITGQGQGFVGLDDDGNLALKPPAGRQLVVDGVVLMKKLADMEALILQQRSAIAQLNLIRLDHGLFANIRTVDNTGPGDVGSLHSFTSLALTTAGVPVISYYDATNGDLKLAVCADVACASGTTIRTIDSTGNVGQFTSLALSTAGFPVVSYWDVTNDDLKLAVCTDATCSSNTTIRTIDSTGSVGSQTSLALTTAGFPVISYYDATNGDLKLAVCADVACASGTIIRTIDSAGNVGGYTSLALTTAGFPVVSYFDETNDDLKLAVCADAACSSNTTIRTIDSTGDVGYYTSLALTAAGFPVISYYNKNGDLKLAP